MKDVSIYFTPLSSEIEFNEGTIGSSIIQYTENNFPEFEVKSVYGSHIHHN